MNFISSSDIHLKQAVLDGYMPTIDINKQSTRRFIQEIGKLGMDEQLLKDINILGQNITAIDTKNYSYVHLGENLSISALSRGERIFLVSLAAKYTGKPLYLQHDITQLTGASMRKYYSLFKDCDNINIICDSEDRTTCIIKTMKGELYDQCNNRSKCNR